MNRRELLKFSGAIALGAGLPYIAQAAPNPMAGGVFYTQGKPGRWSAKVASHVPQLNATQVSGSTVLNVVTPHPMDGHKHYIVKHVVLDADFKFGGEKLFDPLVDQQAKSSFNLGNYKGIVHVLSVCNLHDTWLTAISI